MYILQVRYLFSKHNLEKANGMDGKHLTAEKKGAFIRLIGSQTPCVMTIFGIDTTGEHPVSHIKYNFFAIML